MVKKGKWGETKAREYLEEKGFYLVEQNLRSPFGEVDLIVSKENLLVFVEVKSASKPSLYLPLKVGRQKMRKIAQTALWYLSQNPWAGPIRFDVITVIRTPFQVRHYPGAFTFEDALPGWS